MPFAKGYIPANFKDLSGLRFGRLLVVSRDGFKGPMSAWRCRCNCVWIPIDKQAQNRRSTVYIEVLGEKLCIAEAARRLSVSASSLARWHKNGDTARIQSAQQ